MDRDCRFRSIFFCAVFLISICSLRAEKSPRLDPSRTHAVIVGVLHWQNQSITSYSPENRKDQELHDTLVKLGVPAKNMELLLDEKGTLANIRKALAKVASAAKEGDTLIFYYAGHGVPGRDGIRFLNYDSGKQPSFAVAEIAEILKKNYRGERVLMFADCCFSGGLAKTAETLAEEGFKAASITSAAATNVSTNNWTFTHILIDTLRGNPAADRNGDRVITIAEAAAEVADAMKYWESQQHGQSRFKVREDFGLSVSPLPAGAKAPEEKPYKRFEYVQVQDRGAWRPARITEVDGELFTAEIQQYSTRRVVEIDKDQIRKFPAVTFRRAARPVVMKPEKVLGEKEALEKARAGGKYETLLKKIAVENDYRTYGEFRDYGLFPATNYSVYTDLPEGYWVYVYPNWYIWKSRSTR